MSILNVEHLSHGFGDRAIFQDVSFRLLKGEHDESGEEADGAHHGRQSKCHCRIYELTDNDCQCAENT